jgi:hypothetical protein
LGALGASPEAGCRGPVHPCVPWARLEASPPEEVNPFGCLLGFRGSIVESTLTQFCECIITLFEMQLIVVDSACFAVFKYINYILICDD